MEGFPPEHLDLDMLHAHLAAKDQELAQAVAVVKGLPEGEERFAWASQVNKVREEIGTLQQLIEEKLEYDRGNREAAG